MDETAAHRNIEIKAELTSLDSIRDLARGLGATPRGLLLQRDTYFNCGQGRLKLRETQGQDAQLVWYERPRFAGPKKSDYLLAPVSEPQLLRQTLTQAWGVLVVVEKRRELWLYENVRIHLDTVAGLGVFLELEAVLAPPFDDERGHERVAFLLEQFAIGQRALLADSYADLLLAAQAPRD